SVRRGDSEPEVVRTDGESLGLAVAQTTRRLGELVGDGNVAVIVPSSLLEPVGDALTEAGIAFGHATRLTLDAPVTLVPVHLVKGLELDGVVVVEPGRIVAEEVQGLRALYVALTRATRHLAIV